MINIVISESTGERTLAMITKKSELLQKISGCLDMKEIIKKNPIMFGLIRHGKTANIDNEGDTQKDETVGLSPSEYDFSTSCIARTAEQIHALGFKKVRLYHPSDTLRNTETTKLLEQYLLELNPTLIIEHDKEFEDIKLFQARKQFTTDLYNDLLKKNYLQEREMIQIEGFQGKKHVLGGNRIITLSEKTKKTINDEDPQLFEKVNTLYEESYGTVIDRAGKGIDAFKSYITTKNDPDTFHAVVGYRTTLQACDQVMKSNKDVQGINSFFDIGFAQMNLVGCDQHGNSYHALSTNTRSYDSQTYMEDIKSFEKILPSINQTKTVEENRGSINNLLFQTEQYLEGYLKGNNKKILRRTNIINRALYQDLPPILSRRIIETVLKNYNPKGNLGEVTKEKISKILIEYVINNHEKDENLFNLLYSYKKIILIDDIIATYFYLGHEEKILALLCKEELQRINSIKKRSIELKTIKEETQKANHLHDFTNEGNNKQESIVVWPTVQFGGFLTHYNFLFPSSNKIYAFSSKDNDPEQRKNSIHSFLQAHLKNMPKKIIFINQNEIGQYIGTHHILSKQT